MKRTCRYFVVLASVILPYTSTTLGAPLGTAFTYQGRLQSDGSPADGTFDLRFKMFDAESGGNQAGTTVCIDDVEVVDGLFAVAVDFGAVFDGQERWLEIGVRSDTTPENCGDGSYQTLSPRQWLTAAPYALDSAGPWRRNADRLYYNGGNVGIGFDLPTSLLSFGPSLANTKLSIWDDGVGGAFGLGVQAQQFRFHLNAPTDRFSFYDDGEGTHEIMILNGDGTLEFGADDPDGKQVDAGKIGYKTFSEGLDIVGAGLTAPERRITFWAEGGATFTGAISTNKLIIFGGSDLAENYDVAPATPADSVAIDPKPGMVVVINPAHVGRLKVSTQCYDRRVAGVISGADGIEPGLVLGQKGTVADGETPVANVGRVWCFADADAAGAIEPGDLLTTSATPGHAMKVTDFGQSQGAVLGKAMSRLEKGCGLVLVLVSLQ